MSSAHPNIDPDVGAIRSSVHAGAAGAETWH